MCSRILGFDAARGVDRREEEQSQERGLPIEDSMREPEGERPLY